MARLPTPGSDDGAWGDILNDFLTQSHAADGTLKTDSVGNAQLQDDAVTSSNIADGSIPQAKITNLVSDLVGKLSLTGGTVTGKITMPMPNATDTTHLLVMQQNNAVDANSGEPLQFWFGAIDSGLKTFWLNEGGNPRSESYASDQVAMKLFARRNGGPQTANIFEIFDEDGTLVSRFGATGNVHAPNLATDLTIGTWTALTGTYVNGYAAYAGATYYTPQYRIVHGDKVELRGRIEVDGSAGAPENILTGLPAAARPARNVYLSALQSAGAVTSIEIDTTGTVINQRALSISWISLDGVSYYKGAN